MWGPHLIASRGTESFRCITCARIANHKRARYALETLPCNGRVGLAGPLQPRRPRLKWNRANEARWGRHGEGGHQVVRYNTTQHDGRWLCTRCGLHYVRFCEFWTKQCAGAPGRRQSPSRTPWQEVPYRTGRRTRSRSTHPGPAQGPQEFASQATYWFLILAYQGRKGRAGQPPGPRRSP